MINIGLKILCLILKNNRILLIELNLLVLVFLDFGFVFFLEFELDLLLILVIVLVIIRSFVFRGLLGIFFRIFWRIKSRCEKL